MKKLNLLLPLLFATQIIVAQALIQNKAVLKPPTRNAKTNANAKTAAAAGNVGIGITTPLYPLHIDTNPGYGIVNSSGTTELATYLDASNAWVGTNSNSPLLFYTNNNVNPNFGIGADGKVTVGNTIQGGDFKVYGNSVLTETAEDTKQILIGTNTPNNEAKVLIKNEGFPFALKIEGNNSTSRKAVLVEGGVLIKGALRVEGKIEKSSGSFMIDHPLDPANKYLYHSFVESPDMMNVYNGNTTTDANGIATIKLPAYFEALNTDFRYQLTPIGTFAQAMVLQKVKNNAFSIQTDKPNVEISWQITGIRNDAYARKHRLQVEVPKTKDEQGSFMNPDAFK